MTSPVQPTPLNLQAGRIAATLVGVETIALTGFALFMPGSC
ncbi:hypothetical protein [Ornithinimicrobium sp. INDO-MA30-4]|nr:hypothetical protein [Ornithinimicrobium sp. INDO-MA30-4]